MNSKKEKRVLHDHTLLHYSWLNGRKHKVATSLYSFASFNFTMETVRDFSVTGHVAFLYRAWLLHTYHFFFIIAISICLINLSPRRILISIRTQQDKSPLTPLLSSFLRSEMLLLTSITAKKKKTQRCHTTNFATTDLTRFPSHLDRIGQTISQNSVFYLPRDFEGNNQRLQSSSTGPVGERKKFGKTSGGMSISVTIVVNIFFVGTWKLCAASSTKKQRRQKRLA